MRIEDRSGNGQRAKQVRYPPDVMRKALGYERGAERIRDWRLNE